jgi:hypothetical protein
MTALIPMLFAATAFATVTDDAALFLSRFPAGAVPETAEVIGAIGDLGATGAQSEEPLLRALLEDEAGMVAFAAAEALDALEDRGLDQRRRSFAAEVPSIETMRAVAITLDGSTGLGPAEREAVAYARAVLGNAADSGPQQLDAVAPDQTSQLVADGDRNERAAEPRLALVCYAQAAASGDADAVTRISALGVDVELLLLGMTAATGPAPAAVIAPHTIETVIDRTSDRTVRVMVERAARRAPLVRMSALDTLESLVGSPTRLSETARAAARATLDAAEADDRPILGTFSPLRPPLPH